MSLTPHVHCDRCGRAVRTTTHGDLGVLGTVGTVGYYVCGTGASWCRSGERRLCDCCAFRDPQYIAIYGKHECWNPSTTSSTSSSAS